MYNKQNLYNWIDEILKKRISTKVIAINFNLTEYTNNSYKVQIIGSNEFDENNDDWACKEVFTTGNEQFQFKLDGGWKVVLENISEDLKSYVNSSSKLLSYKAVGVGFVDGDIITININENYKIKSKAPKLADKDYYRLTLDRKKDFIFLSKSNLKEIELFGHKKGYFSFFQITEHFGFSDEQFPLINFYYDNDTKKQMADYISNINNWSIVSGRVVEKLQNLSINGVKFFKVNLIENTTKAVNTDYYFMYIENFIDAYDMDKSKYNYFEDTDSYSFLPMDIVLSKENCSSYDIFRCLKNKQAIYLSRKLKDVILSEGWTGFKLAPQK